MAVYLNTDELDKKIALAGMNFGEFARYIGMNPATLSCARHGRPVRPITLHRIALGLSRLKTAKVLDGMLTTDPPKKEAEKG